MPLDPTVIPSLISAASGLGGVGLGGWLTSRRETVRERERKERELSYLAILVSAHLDRMAHQCMNVAFDDGTSEGQPAGDDRESHVTTVGTPSFDPLSLDVDWKVLSPDLMNSILGLPYRQEQLERHVDSKLTSDDMPYFTDFFLARQHGFAELGLLVSDVARKLRRHAGLPAQTALEGTRDPDEVLREQRDWLATKRSEYDARVAKNTAELRSMGL